MGKKSKSNFYFGSVEEEAVVRFLQSNNQLERDSIYKNVLMEPISKMIDSIIRRYNLYRKDISFEELHMDTLSFLMTKANKFENSKGKKAYSYYGTICKHYLIGLLMKDEKYLKQSCSYEEISETLNNDVKISYNIGIADENVSPLITLIKRIVRDIKDTLKKGEFDETNSKRKVNDRNKLTENEIKVGNMLIDILSDWENIFDDMEGGNKFNKISILSTLREGTNLSTKDISVAMKRYKYLYSLIKESYINEGLL